MDRQTDRQAGRQAGKQIDTGTKRQTGERKKTNRLMEIERG